METPNQFKLELAVDNYLQELQAKGNYTPDDLAELKSHLLDETDVLLQKQLNQEEAFIIAKKRLGSDEELNREYTKVNGLRFYNRDMFITALSICTFIFLFYFYSFVIDFLWRIILLKGSNPFVWGIINYTFQVLFLTGILFLTFKSKKYIAFLEKRFVKSPANFSAIFIFLLVAIYIFFRLEANLFQIPAGLTRAERLTRFKVFTIDYELSNAFAWLFPAIWMLAIFMVFTKSYKKINFLQYLINDSGYIALFFLGMFWDFVAAVSRTFNSLFQNNDAYKAFLFGMVWFAGMLIFSYYLKKNILIRTLYFIAFGFLMELSAGIWLNSKLTMGLPVSIYFLALVIGVGLGLLAAQLIKEKPLKVVK